MFRRMAFLTALVLIVSACGTNASEDSVTSETGSVQLDADATPPTTSPDTFENAVLAPDSETSALDNRTNPVFPTALIDISQIISGGPPPDGIPPVDAPEFVTVVEADEYLSDAEPVVYVSINGDTRAYPVQILIWHEIVNDVVGGVPVSVTYCPLCNSAVTFERVVGGEVTTFGTSGSLFNSALIMYDRATESLWTHYDGRAVVGTATGEELEPVASPLLAWGDYKELFPNTLVLDRDKTGFSRRYGSNPYVGYDNPEGTPFLFRGETDDRAALQQRVVGVEIDGSAVGFSLDSLSGGDAQATSATVGSTDIAIFWKAGQSTALEAGGTDGGRDVGSVFVFDAMLDGQLLTFSAQGDSFVDDETASVWTITGLATSGSLEGSQLTPIHHLDTFWFAWSSYQPGTELVE